MPFPDSYKVNSRRQSGFTLIELTIVIGIIALLAVFAVPRVNSFIIEAKVPTVGRELQRMIITVRNAHAGMAINGVQPYANVTTPEAGNNLRETSFSWTGAANAPVRHSIGATDGTLTLTPATITTQGDSALITLTSVNRGACPLLATVMDKAIVGATVNGAIVKLPNAGAATSIDATAATNACTDGDTNTFTFTFR